MTRQRRYLRLVIVTLIVVFLVVGLKNLPRTQALENGVARTPPMGWNSWNNFACNLTPQLVEQTADVIVSTGMRDAGYVFVNLDDCWQDWRRTEDEHIVLDPDFQSPAWEGGMKALADYVHSKGLKLGLYSERGSRTCQGRMGSWGFETIDAQDYAAWGADYLKYDNCNIVAGSTMEGDDRNMLAALLGSGRDIVFSLCNWLFYDFEPEVGNLWRTTGDISASWTSIMSLYDQNVSLAGYAKPGAWNDPDMLEVGRGSLTLAENRSHFGLWSIMAAPLLTGNDLRVMTDPIKNILMNPEVIAVDQDPLGIQGVKVRDDGNYEVLVKVLHEPSTRAVALLNRASAAADITVSWSEIGLPPGRATVRDLWTHTDLGTFNDSFTVNVGTHDTAMLKIVSLEPGPTVVPPPPPTRTPAPTVTPFPTPPAPKQDPVVWYKFDETSGTTAVDSMGYRNATLTSGPTWVTGHEGNAVNLDGSNDYVNIPNPSGGSGLFRYLTDFTIAAWVQLDAAKTRAVVWNFGTGTWIYMYLEPNSSANTVRFGMTLWRDTYYTQHVDSASALPIGGWHHVAVTKAGKTAILYVDGDEVGRNSNMWLTAYNLGNTSQNYIGRPALSTTSPTAPYLDGQIDDFRVYNRALSKSEIRSFGNVPPAVSNDVASQNVQYSDAIQPVTVSATDIASDLPGLSASTQWSVDGGAFQPGLPSGLTFTPGPCPVNGMYGTCTWTLAGTVPVKPGTYVVRTTVSDGSASSNTDVTIVVTPEDARPYYNGNLLFWTSSVNSTSANVTLSAAVLDATALPTTDPAYDPYPGDIRNAKVTFFNRETGEDLLGCIGLPVGLVSAGDTETGMATCNTTLTADNNTGASQYTVGIAVSGYYARNSSEDDVIVTVAQPIPSNFITGGGYLVLSNSSGLVPGTAGSKANFGFNVKYNKGGTNLQGHVNIIVRSGGHVYQIKATALSSLGVAGTKANFSSKANITDITDPLNPISIGGNATLQVWMTDNGEPGTSDTLGIQLLNKDGGTWFTSNWNGTKTVEQTLGGGNLSVH
jgi:alpha-galactosidase